MKTLKRRIAMLLSIVMLLPMCLTARAEYTPKYTTEAEVLFDLGLFKGTGFNADGTPVFDLDKNATRIQGIVMLIRLLGEEEAALACTAEHPFTDVPTWANSYVAYAYEKKYTNGTGNNTFGSDDKLLGKAYVTFVLRALGYNDAADDFSYNSALTFGAELGLLESGTCDGALYRDDCALLSYNALRTTLKDSDTKLIEKLEKDGAVTNEAVQNSELLLEKVAIPCTISSDYYNDYIFDFKGEDILTAFPDATYFTSAGYGGNITVKYSLDNMWRDSRPVRKGDACKPNVASGSSCLIGMGDGKAIIVTTILDKNRNLIGYCVMYPGFACERESVLFTVTFYNGNEESKRIDKVIANIKTVDASAIYLEKIKTIKADGTEDIKMFMRIDESKWPSSLPHPMYWRVASGGDKDSLLGDYSRPGRNQNMKAFEESSFFRDDHKLGEDAYMYLYNEARDIVAISKLATSIPIVETIIYEDPSMEP